MMNMLCLQRCQLTTVLVLVDILTCSSTRVGITYYPSTYALNWTAASTDCQHIGGSLAKITTADENAEVANFLVQWNVEKMMIGGSDAAAEGAWIWEDGSALDLTIPHTHHTLEPTEDYLEIWKDARWNDITDEVLNRFFCEIDEASSEAQTVAAIRACWVANGLFVPPPGTSTKACPRGTLYFTPESIRALGTWSAARSVCQEAGGDLAKVTTLEEHSIITRLRSLYYNMGDAWIGGTDSDGDGTYSWADGDTFTWPSYPGPTPTATGQCLLLTTTNTWVAETCTSFRRFICERDISLSRKYGEVCFWNIPSAIWTTLQDNCQTAGGSLAKVDNAEEWQMVSNVHDGNNPHYLGSQDPENDNRFGWSDGTVITWSYWNNGEPNNAGENCITSYSIGGWNDAPCTLTYQGNCEKSVDSNIEVALSTKLIQNDKVVYRCDEGYFFDDYTTEKTYTCSSTDSFVDFVSSLSGCGKIIIMEARFEDYTAADLSPLYDGNIGTCLTLSDYWTYLPMTTVRTGASGTFTVSITLGADVQMIAEQTTKVFVSRSGIYTADYYGPTELYNKCDSLPNLSFSCQCTGVCSLYVRFRFMSMAATAGVVYTVCEINIT